ncbi:hypothetical protein ORS3428_27870 [Mesorhizobium sp. ORS 3428]|nr:hypothetical protein ORS3428_27870 [Mesorhizobium sp. ORS 3428]
MFSSEKREPWTNLGSGARAGKGIDVDAGKLLILQSRRERSQIFLQAAKLLRSVWSPEYMRLQWHDPHMAIAYSYAH